MERIIEEEGLDNEMMAKKTTKKKKRVLRTDRNTSLSVGKRFGNRVC